MLALTITLAGGPVLVHVERPTSAGPTVQQLELRIDHQVHDAERPVGPPQWILHDLHPELDAFDTVSVSDVAVAVVSRGSD